MYDDLSDEISSNRVLIGILSEDSNLDWQTYIFVYIKLENVL